MRLFVSEYLCCGAWGDTLRPPGLAAEGRAMLRAAVHDFAGIPDVTVATTYDAALGAHGLNGVEVHIARAPSEEQSLFARLAVECDATFLIAPEFDGILAARCRAVEAAGGRLLGPSSGAAELCADKWRLASHWYTRGVATIKTHLLDPRFCDEIGFPAVVKPRDGAGSQAMFLVRNHDEFRELLPQFTARAVAKGMIWQPYIAGQALSVAAIVSPAGGVQVWPVCEQHLSADGRFRYGGGRLPARCAQLEAVQALARRACECVSGLRGYVGIDLLLPTRQYAEPLVVEINPRLTTSYLGYRALAAENLARRMLAPDCNAAPVAWRPGTVQFDACDNVDEAG